MPKLRGRTIAAIISVIAIISASLVVYFAIRGPAQPKTVELTFDLSVLGDDARSAVTELLDDFATLNPLVRLVSFDASSPVNSSARKAPDVRFIGTIPAESNEVFRPWRTLGWRLFSFLPTLANYEGEWRRQMILPLTHNEVSLESFLDILQAGKTAGVTPIALVENAESLMAWNAYVERLDVNLDGFTTTYRYFADALKDFADRKIMFLFWNDSLPSMVPEPLRPQYRGFSFPGSREGAHSFFVGESTSITLSAEASEQSEAHALVKYLTSPGVARTLQRRLIGEFFTWPSELKDDALPEVIAPGEILSNP
jgi:hypothetical protein